MFAGITLVSTNRILKQVNREPFVQVLNASMHS